MFDGSLKWSKFKHSWLIGALTFSVCAIDAVALPIEYEHGPSTTVRFDIDLGVTRTRDATSKGQRMNALLKAFDSTNTQIDLGTAASLLGYDHFSAINIIRSSPFLRYCVSSFPSVLPGCGPLTDLNGYPVGLPTYDPPGGGWAYQGAGGGVAAQDMLPYYFDEVFKRSDGLYPWEVPYTASKFLKANDVFGEPATSAYGYVFNDAPSPENITSVEPIVFLTAFVGVKGACTTLSRPTDCTGTVLFDTLFEWASHKGIVQLGHGLGPYGEVVSPPPPEDPGGGGPIIVTANPIDFIGDDLFLLTPEQIEFAKVTVDEFRDVVNQIAAVDEPNTLILLALVLASWGTYGTTRPRTSRA